MRVCNEFLVGADPEFLVRAPRGDEIVNLQEFLPNGLETKLGYDHSGWVGECRPSPSTSTFEVVKDLRQTILRMNPENYVALHNAGKWEAGGGKYYQGRDRLVSLGGHLHFGLEIRETPPSPYWPREQTLRGSRGIECLDRITGGLEFLDILPQQESAARRRLTSYGSFGEIRFNGEAHFEYRSMASWLAHPETALLVLTLGKLAMRFPISLYKCLPSAPGEFTEGLLAEVVHRGAQRHADDDCRILWEQVFGEGRKLQHDYSADFREAWREMKLGRARD